MIYLIIDIVKRTDMSSGIVGANNYSPNSMLIVGERYFTHTYKHIKIILQ